MPVGYGVHWRFSANIFAICSWIFSEQTEKLTLSMGTHAQRRWGIMGRGHQDTGVYHAGATWLPSQKGPN
jgi:hypothetical protein